MFRCCFVFSSLLGGGRQAQVGDFLILDTDFLRPLRLHAPRHHTPGPQVHRLETAAAVQCVATLPVLQGVVIFMTRPSTVKWTLLMPHSDRLCVRYTDLCLTMKQEIPCIRYCFSTLLYVYTLPFLNAVTHNTYFARNVRYDFMPTGPLPLVCRHLK